MPIPRVDHHIVHEAAHMYVGIEGVDDVAMQFDGHSYTHWRKQAYRDATHDLACSLAGPLGSMMCTGVVNPHLDKPDGATLERVLPFLRASQNGSTIDDAGTILRRSYDEIAQALPQAFDAASKAYMAVVNCTSRWRAVFEVLDQIAPHECLVLDYETLCFLRGAGKSRLRLPIVSFSRWYNLGITPEMDDARNEELRLECLRIHAEMHRLGQLDARGLPNAAGLRRLQLNENR